MLEFPRSICCRAGSGLLWWEETPTCGSVACWSAEVVRSTSRLPHTRYTSTAIRMTRPMARYRAGVIGPTMAAIARQAPPIRIAPATSARWPPACQAIT